MARNLFEIQQPATEIPRYLFRQVTIPSGASLHQGNVLRVGDFSTATNQRFTFVGEQVTDVNSDIPGFIYNQGVFENTNKQRVAGNPDPSTFTYSGDHVLDIILPAPGLIFFISADAFSGNAVEDQYIIAQNDSYELIASASLGANVKMGLQVIENTTSYRIGGAAGANQFISGSYVKVVRGLGSI